MQKKKEALKGLLTLTLTLCFGYISLTSFLAWKTLAQEGFDMAAPVLTAFEIVPGTINTENAPVVVTINATITDDLSGVAFSEGETQLKMVPNSDVEQAVIFTFVHDTGDDYTATATFPRYSAVGTWDIEYFYLVDNSGKSLNISKEDVENIGGLGSATITNNATTEDITAPTLDLFIFDAGKTINTDAAAQNVQINMSITDDLSGVDIDEIQFRMRPVSGINQTVEFTGFVDNLGVYGSTASFPMGSAIGEWIIERIILVDILGNTRTISLWDDELNQPDSTAETSFETDNGGGVAGSARINNTATNQDIEAPEVVSMSITPTTFDTTDGTATLNLEIVLTDDITGVYTTGESFTPTQVRIRSVVSSEMLSFVDLTLTEGDDTDGTYTSSLTLPQNSKPGIWKVEYVLATDKLGNTTYHTYDDLMQIENVDIDLLNTEQVTLVTIDSDFEITSNDADIIIPANAIITTLQATPMSFHRFINTSYNASDFSDFGTLITFLNSLEPIVFDFNNLFNGIITCEVEENCQETTLTADGFLGEPIRILRTGIPGLNLNFSEPVQITLKNLEEYEGVTLYIQTFQEGGIGWTEHSTCTVSEGSCIFDTTHASFFAASVLGVGSGPDDDENEDGTPILNESEEETTETLPQTGLAVISAVSFSATCMLAYTSLKRYVFSPKKDE